MRFVVCVSCRRLVRTPLDLYVLARDELFVEQQRNSFIVGG